MASITLGLHAKHRNKLFICTIALNTNNQGGSCFFNPVLYMWISRFAEIKQDCQVLPIQQRTKF